MKLKSHFVTPKILYFTMNFTWGFGVKKTGDNENLKLIKVPFKNLIWN